jgi:hypothetical protein
MRRKRKVVCECALRVLVQVLLKNGFHTTFVALVAVVVAVVL